MKRNPVFWVALGLPVLFILFLVIFVTLPAQFVKPAHDFLYTNSDIYNYGTFYQNRLNIEDGKLVLVPMPPPAKNDNYPRVERVQEIFRYNVKSNTTREISLEEAQRLSLASGPSSPDGYTVQYSSDGYGFFDVFGGDSYRGYVISKDGKSKKLLGLPQDGYGSRFEVIGWIK